MGTVVEGGFGPGNLSGITALERVAAYYGIRTDHQAVIHELALAGRTATTADIVRAASMVGLSAEARAGLAGEQLAQLPRPCIIRLKSGEYVALGQQFPSKVQVFRGVEGPPELRDTKDIVEQWSGEALLITKPAPATDEDGASGKEARFGIGWLIPTMMKHRSTVISVLITSLFLQVFALGSPLLFQVIIDKVLVHESISTLVVVVFGLVVLGILDPVLQYLRTYALTHMGSRIDIELGRKLIAHLFKLPLSYFESKPAGQIVARVNELEMIRGFLTGPALTTIIDVVFAVVFLVVLYLYSTTLALVVTASLPVYFVIGAVVGPILRRRAMTQFSAMARSNQFLVESVLGAHTIKASAAEPLVQRQWNERFAHYAQSAFSTTSLGAGAQGTVQLTNKLGSAAVLFFGALLVINRRLTIGELVAFNMIANQMSGPILRISQLWQSVQQFRLSMDRLGDVLNHPAEQEPVGMAHYPTMKGAISYRDVSFRYKEGGRDVLKGITLEIPAGQVVGIVGRSGSGKSTLAKLLQRMYLPSEGSIAIDGCELANVHSAWVRSQIGVVLQENFLFNRTVHENIALSVPTLSPAEVVFAARLAGAHEFISELPQGYSTIIEERGANLSGGQRQRIAIARALTRNPRILVFDEATSALDYESERIIQKNMREIVRGRTVLIIAHRLAAVSHCDRIIALEDGRIVEDGSHAELMRRQDGVYKRLWDIQAETSVANG
jgi:subfamily B ATP-binding cassette protein HlyB/CyaB